ncbi:arabinose operon transcriptional regulator AraC [soil metagenome]
MRRKIPADERPYHAHTGLWADEFRRSASYENWRSQGTRDWLLILTVGGAGRVGTSCEEILSEPGTVTVYEPGTSQFYYTDPEVGNWHLLWAHFHPRPHWMPWLRWDKVSDGLRMVKLSGAETIRKVKAAVGESVKQCGQRSPCSADLALNALERALLLIYATDPSGRLDPRVRKATELLLERVKEPFSLPSLAETCGLSVSRLLHLFTKEIGSSPQQYLEGLRLRRAAHLLRSSGLSVSEIADETGYANAFYFSNRFKKALGKSPSDFRHSGD